jgi:hypothetical protein
MIVNRLADQSSSSRGRSCRRAMITVKSARCAPAILVLGTGSTAAYATLAGGPVDSSGVIHGCWTNAAINGTHVFVLQDAGTTCPKGTTAISWNQQGQQGPSAPPGPGPAGPAGPKKRHRETGTRRPARSSRDDGRA